jgi:hypothetical protein
LRVFDGHDTNPSLDPHFGFDNLLRFFAAAELGGFLTLKGPRAAASAKLAWAA